MKFLVALVSLMVFFIGYSSTQVDRSDTFMGSELNLKAEGFGASKAADESFERIGELQTNILADTKKLELAAGNGEFIQIDADVFKIIKIAQEYSALTDGAFDVTIGAAVDLWKGGNIPADTEIASIKPLVNYKNLELRESDNSARLNVAGMKINLGGVAKGYAVDVVRQIFIKHGIGNGLIDFGTSSIYGIGEKRIGIKNPRDENNIAEIVDIKDSAISTSGDYEKFFIVDGRRYSHILNPKTCTPVETDIASVSVIVDGKVENCATVADILSTTVFVLGKRRTEEILLDVSLPEPVKITVFVDG